MISGAKETKDTEASRYRRKSQHFRKPISFNVRQCDDTRTSVHMRDNKLTKAIRLKEASLSATKQASQQIKQYVAMTRINQQARKLSIKARAEKRAKVQGRHTLTNKPQ